ncbi:cupin domain-containing protein [Methyloterricola oryzae]|uniref:cupin domain-containing protein n=1 Tax=Methyloterricola oryzae TaxID=1495050 RepID=UPI000B17AA46|nr:cupin domain-containing protein [Methyloterricola oryzae]
MPLIDAQTARRFAESRIDAWSRHDLDAVLSHYVEDFEFSSPLIVDIAGEPSGHLKGKNAIRAYWAKGLERLSDLHFDLVEMLGGIDQAVLYYRGHRGMAAECFEFDGTGKVIRASANYADAPLAQASLNLPALDPASVSARTSSIYPTEEMRQRMTGHNKQALGDALGLQNCGVNFVRLEPGAMSALRHWHSRQDEFIYVLEGELTLVTENGEQVLGSAVCAGFPAGKPDGHHLINRTDRVAVYLEVGDRLPGDWSHYPDVDLEARATRGGYGFFHKERTPYETVSG